MDYGKEREDELNRPKSEEIANKDWAYSNERNLRAFGNKIISSPDQINQPHPSSYPDQFNSPDQTNYPGQAPQLSSPSEGAEQVQINQELIQGDPNLPPGYKDDSIRKSAQDSININPEILQSIDKSALKTDDVLDPRAIEAIDNLVEKMNQDGDIASFYDAARDMTEVNLENSYNRKIGEQ